MLDILLINPRPSFLMKYNVMNISSGPPMGLLYIAAYLREKGYQPKILDLAVDSVSQEEFEKLLKQEKPRVVGLSCCTESVNPAVRICALVKQWNPSCHTVLGGSHATFDDLGLVSLDYVDFVVRHEGEETMAELLKALTGSGDLSKIKGLTWKKEKQVVTNEARERIKNLDALPYPARDLVTLEKYALPFTIVTSRGCPKQCVFCSAGNMAGNQYRVRSARSVFAELKQLYTKQNMRVFHILDDTFTAVPGRVLEICTLIKSLPEKIYFFCESRADVVNREMLNALREAGCVAIMFGIESGSDRILKEVRKGITTQQIREAVRTAHEAGLFVKGSVMIGLAGDTHETIAQTAALIRELQDKYNLEAYCGVNTPFPGTEQYINRSQYGIKIHSDTWDDFNAGNPVISTRHLTREDLGKYLEQLTAETMPKNQKLWEKQKKVYENIMSGTK